MLQPSYRLAIKRLPSGVIELALFSESFESPPRQENVGPCLSCGWHSDGLRSAGSRRHSEGTPWISAAGTAGMLMFNNVPAGKLVCGKSFLSKMVITSV